MKLHIQTLIDKNACAKQVALFRSTFGNSVNVTQKLCVSVADKFDWAWAARHLLTPKAIAEHQRVAARALTEYNRVMTRALAEYNRVTAPDLVEYNRVTAPALAEHNRLMARAFAKGYNS